MSKLNRRDLLKILPVAAAGTLLLREEQEPDKAVLRKVKVPALDVPAGAFIARTPSGLLVYGSMGNLSLYSSLDEEYCMVYMEAWVKKTEHLKRLNELIKEGGDA